MDGDTRRQEIIHLLQRTKEPISGTKLAEQLHVSRQVIVQDIALLRTANFDIVSTTRGYLLNRQSGYQRIIKSAHTDAETEEELQIIVDYGGTAVNVFVNHKVYGQIQADLNISNRNDIKDFVADIASGKSTHLKNLTSNYHYHTIRADSEERLDRIEKALDERGFLIYKEA